jgi:Flp pilus assembly protein TadD
LQAAPREPRLYYYLGIVLWEQRRPEEAEHAYRQALTLEPKSDEAWYELGNTLFAQRREEEAQEAYERAVALRAKFPEAHNGLARALIELRRPGDAVARCRRALALQPTNWKFHTVLGSALRELGQFKEAETAFRRAVSLAPPAEVGMPRYNLGFLLLKMGEFQRGWPFYEARFEVGHAEWSLREKPRFTFPEWRGEDLSGRTILVWPEQGFGDAIQFARYVKHLRSRGARITLACWPPLRTLFESLSGPDELLSTDEIGSRTFDYWTLIASIPGRLVAELPSIPTEIPYLTAPEGRVAAWRARVPRAGFRVGLVWKGRAEFGHDRFRSLESFALLRPLWDVPGVSFLSLQKGVDENLAPMADQPIAQLGPQIGDFADTAAILSEIDLLISSDTAIVHLAGALGRPVWVLVPSYHSDWRWPREGAHMPWYPGVMRLFHQSRDGDWRKTIPLLAATLREEVARLKS